MFLYLCVILFMGGGVSVPACITGRMTGGLSGRGGLCPDGNLCPGVSVQGVSIWGVSVWGDHLCPDLWGGFCPGVSVQGGLCQGDPPDRDPPVR